MEESTLRILEVIGSWISGFGALLAVATSLYLANKQNKISLSVVAGIRLIVTPGRPETPEFVSIKITNTGNVTAIINNIAWKFSGKGKPHLVQTFHGIRESCQIPYEINPGREAHFLIPLADGTWISDIAKDIDKKKPAKSAATMKCTIYTTTNKSFSTKVEKNLIDKIIEKHRENS